MRLGHSAFLISVSTLLCSLCALVLAFGENQPGSRRLSFSGYTWIVKQSNEPVGPGGNYFSDAKAAVFVDSRGALHLRLRKVLGRWWAVELSLDHSLGYGAYSFELASRVDNLDPNVVAGFFTWSDSPAFAHRELDIEFSRWGDPLANWNAQFVVQPAGPDSTRRYHAAQSGEYSSHRLVWRPDSVSFDSRHGHASEAVPFESLYPMSAPGNRAGPTWTYAGAKVPRAGDEGFRINLYLDRARPPATKEAVELIVSSFGFAPLPSDR